MVAVDLAVGDFEDPKVQWILGIFVFENPIGDDNGFSSAIELGLLNFSRGVGEAKAGWKITEILEVDLADVITGGGGEIAQGEDQGEYEGKFHWAMV